MAKTKFLCAVARKGDREALQSDWVDFSCISNLNGVGFECSRLYQRAILKLLRIHIIWRLNHVFPVTTYDLELVQNFVDIVECTDL